MYWLRPDEQASIKDLWRVTFKVSVNTIKAPVK